MRHLMSPLDFTVEELDNLMDLAQDIEKNPKKYAHACDGKKLATLFFEPSTRTSKRALQKPCHQCTRRLTSASDADLDRSDDDPFFKRSS